jgi:spermidine synthase
MTVFSETLYDDYRQQFVVDEVLFEEKTEHQHLVIFSHRRFGRVMALDGIVQTTEGDEFIYHEMAAHVPILAHGAVKNVLIIGGGDGGMLREVVKHKEIKRVVQVEIDPTVVETSKTHLPRHSSGAYDDSRLELVFADGAEFIRTSQQAFDVIIVDSTDPIGPGEALFTKTFYQGCAERLSPTGILVTQNGVAFMQPDEARDSAALFRQIFIDWGFFSAAIPTYIGGVMLFGWASQERGHRHTSQVALEQRFQDSGIITRYYTPAIHQASFALPRYVENSL